jgi:hypothetical protein
MEIHLVCSPVHYSCGYVGYSYGHCSHYNNNLYVIFKNKSTFSTAAIKESFFNFLIFFFSNENSSFLFNAKLIHREVFLSHERKIMFSAPRFVNKLSSNEL